MFISKFTTQGTIGDLTLVLETYKGSYTLVFQLYSGMVWGSFPIKHLRMELLDLLIMVANWKTWEFESTNFGQLTLLLYLRSDSSFLGLSFSLVWRAFTSWWNSTHRGVFAKSLVASICRAYFAEGFVHLALPKVGCWWGEVPKEANCMICAALVANENWLGPTFVVDTLT